MKFNITLADLDALNPCNTAESYLGKDWSGTLIDILEHPSINVDDKIWAVTKLIDDKTARLFACYCAKESLQYVKDETLKKVLSGIIEVSVRFAHGNATDDERSAAWSAARSAARSAAAESAAWSAAAESAAWSAAWSAAESAAESAAWSAARSAAWYAQIQELIVLVKELRK